MLIAYSFDWSDFKFLKLFKDDEEEKAREIILKSCRKIKDKNKEGKGGCLVWFSNKNGSPVSRQNYISWLDKWEEKYYFKKGEG